MLVNFSFHLFNTGNTAHTKHIGVVR